MRCVLCGNLSLAFLCKSCKKDINPKLSKRQIQEDFEVFSFFAYNDISQLLHTKHHACGVWIYKYLAKISFLPFFKILDLKNILIIPVDDKIKSGYSHTAILAKYAIPKAKLKDFKPTFRALRAKNSITYSGKSLSYRKSHARNFQHFIKPNSDVILIDDLVTTGTTLLEAKKILEKSNINVLFALTLADAKVK